jgi:AcrR family transcriptional regulator
MSSRASPAKRRTATPVHPKATRRSGRARITREKLLTAALECVSDLGYRGATMDEIVARAGLSRGAQMHHFPTKLDLMEAAFDYMLSNLIEDIRKHTDGIRERRERPEEVFEYLWKKHFSGWIFSITMEIVVASRSDPDLMARAAPISERFHRGLDDCWYILCRDSTMKESRLVLVLNLTMTLLRGMGFQKVLWDRPEYFDQLLREWMNITRRFFEIGDSESRD